MFFLFFLHIILDFLFFSWYDSLVKNKKGENEMKKLQLKSWVQTVLTVWVGIDCLLVAMALYMSRILEIGL